MSLRITEDINSVSELKKNAKQIFEQAHNNGRPIIITVGGKPDVVLMDAKVFEKKMIALSLFNLITEAETDVKKGRLRLARDLIKELRG